MDRYDENAFYYSPTENVWCWEQSSKGKIFKASTKSELLKIKNKNFLGSGNYKKEKYNLGEGFISAEEFGKITGIGGKAYVSMLLKRGTTPINVYDKNSGGAGVHKPENRRKKGLHFINCLKKSNIKYSQIINQFNTKVWVFKNLGGQKIVNFKKYWKEK